MNIDRAEKAAVTRAPSVQQNNETDRGYGADGVERLRGLGVVA